ncbi:MAG: hypothetical protein CME61_08700 [Halobacteriovoraceae bacterium]|nr:hypothetical protein [Halobacteriovoraceae bacterium]OUX68072.1 MAG: hypothetical protein CBD38_00450 [bacterium TMED178]
MADPVSACEHARAFCEIPGLAPAIISAGGFLLSSAIAVVAIFRNQVISRRRATVDMVLHQKSDSQLQDHIDKFNELRSNSKNMPLSAYAGDDHKGTAESKAILAVLNNYEFIASGVFQNAFDFELYKRMQYGVVVDRWDSLESFVKDIRKSRNHPTLFQEFEKLACKFKVKPLGHYKK